MVKAKLCKTTVISPRSDYELVAKALAEFSDFHVIQQEEFNPDKRIQQLDAFAVKLFSQAEQLVRDLNLTRIPGVIDTVFRGVKIEKKNFNAESWEKLLYQANSILSPYVQQVSIKKELLQRIQKEIQEKEAILELLSLISSYNIDFGELNRLKRLMTKLVLLPNKAYDEFQRSVEGVFVFRERLSDLYSLVLTVSTYEDLQRVEKAIKAFSGKEISIPQNLPQKASEAYEKLKEELNSLYSQRDEANSALKELAEKNSQEILAILELAEACRDALDEIRASGSLERFAYIKGYIPYSRKKEFEQKCSEWIVCYEEPEIHSSENDVPTLIENPRPMRTFQLLTYEQGIPSLHEVDPTPLVSFIFPIFFGIMFGDLGHGLVMTLFSILLIKRGVGNIREWGKIFLTFGLSASFFGIIFGEFFGLSLHSILPIPTVLEIVQRPFGQNPTLDPNGVNTIIVVSLFLGVIHLLIALTLNFVQALRAKENIEAFLVKLPALTLYIGGIAFGFSFVGAGLTFNILSTNRPIPLIGVQTNVLGIISLVLIFSSIIVILFGKAVAIVIGRYHGESIASAIGLGALEAFERILQFLANTISYVRIGVMLLIHAALLLIVNQYVPLSNPATIVPWVIFNVLIITFEALIVYIQDLRLHVYEFFTKFFEGNGVPFKRIFQEKLRTKVNWT